MDLTTLRKLRFVDRAMGLLSRTFTRMTVGHHAWAAFAAGGEPVRCLEGR
jgi:hypothetical protein